MTEVLNGEILGIMNFSLCRYMDKPLVFKCILVKEYDTMDKPIIEHYFIFNELKEILSYKCNSVSRSIKTEDKRILKRQNVINFKSTGDALLKMGYNTIDPNSIPNRGHLLVNLGAFYKLVLNSLKPELEGFKNWIFNSVIPNVVETGAYIDPSTNYTDLYNDFSTLYYSYNENIRRYNMTNMIRIIDKRGYSRELYELGFDPILNDKVFLLKLYNAAFYVVFERTYEDACGYHDLSISCSFDNPLEIANKLGGIQGIKSVKMLIKTYIMMMLELGYTIEDITSMAQFKTGNYNFRRNTSLLSIPDGPLFRSIYSDKREMNRYNVK